MKPTPHIARFAEAIALLTKQPRTPLELSTALGTLNKMTAYKYITALREEGLIYVREWVPGVSGKPSPRYAMQPSVCAFADAPRPWPPRFRRKPDLDIVANVTGLRVEPSELPQVAPYRT
jgi:hypothetical protein